MSIEMDLAAEHLDEAGFLFGQWQHALCAPQYTLPEIAAGPEARLLAHLDALVLGGPPVAEELLVPALQGDDPGSVFAAAYSLAAAEPAPRLEPVLEVLGKDDPTQCGAIVRALATVPLEGVGQRLLESYSGCDAITQRHLLATLANLGLDPGQALDPLANNEDPLVAALGFQLGAMLPLRLNPLLLARAWRAAEPLVRASAIETGVLLGTPGALEALDDALQTPSPAWGRLALVRALVGDAEAVPLLTRSFQEPELQKHALFALGFTGQLAALDQLLPLLEDSQLSPVAAEAFCCITGLTLQGALVLPPNDDDLGPESDLPIPAPGPVAKWWDENRNRFSTSVRWLFGQPWSPAVHFAALEGAPARRREGLALELAMRTRGECPVTWNALSRRQERELARARGQAGFVFARSMRERLPAKGLPKRSRAPLAPLTPVMRRSAPPQRALAVTGVGLATNLGGTITTCAAVRCGLSRPAPLEFTVLDEEALEPVAACGFPHPALDGFEGHARYLKLATQAVRELVAGWELDPKTAGKMGLGVCLSPARPDEWDFFDALLAAELPGPLWSATRMPAATLTGVLSRGNAAGAWGLEWARNAFEQKELERAVLVGIDTLVPSEVLERLAEDRRLKTSDAPAGLMPGEGSAALLVEPAGVAKRRGARILGFVDEVAIESGKSRASQGQPATARALAKAILRAWPEGLPVGAMYADLNGETARASEWGVAQGILCETRDLSKMRLETPALSLGDTGAAGGLLAIIAALRSFARGQALSEHCLVWSNSDNGDQTAVLVSAPQ